MNLIVNSWMNVIIYISNILNLTSNYSLRMIGILKVNIDSECSIVNMSVVINTYNAL